MLYQVNPIVGVIPPGSVEPVVVMLKRMSSYPDRSDPRKLKHKFLIQTAVYDTDSVPLIDFWHQKEAEHKAGGETAPAYLEKRIVCELAIPEEPASAAAPANSSSSAAASSEEVAALTRKLEERQTEYQGLMDYSIRQSTTIRQLEQRAAQLEAERTTLMGTQDTLTARNESLRARVAEFEKAQEREVKARADASAKAAAPKSIAERLQAPADALLLWQVLAAVVLAFIIAAVLF
mgnify:CR=1 FL=1